MNGIYWLRALRAWWKFRAYKPIEITPALVMRWLSQYPAESRSALLQLLENVEFLDEDFVVNSLVQNNRAILDRLKNDGVGPANIIYVSHHDAGSSSPFMLSLLRDSARLERSGASFIDSRDQLQLSKVTAKLNTGAIIFVDDFAGTGNQFVQSQAWSSQFIAGSFSQFFLAVVICEEALDKIEAVDVVPISSIVHAKSDRTLLVDCLRMSTQTRASLIALGSTIDRKYSLGYKSLATNIVLYRNAPNSTPLLLRGNLGQTPKFGVLPRTTDLPQLTS